MFCVIFNICHYLSLCTRNRSMDSVITVVPRLQAGQSSVRASVSSPSCPDLLQSPHNFVFYGYWELFPGVKWQANNWRLPISRIKNEWNHTSTTSQFHLDRVLTVLRESAWNLIMQQNGSSVSHCLLPDSSHSSSSFHLSCKLMLHDLCSW